MPSLRQTSQSSRFTQYVSCTISMPSEGKGDPATQAADGSSSPCIPAQTCAPCALCAIYIPMALLCIRPTTGTAPEPHARAMIESQQLPTAAVCEQSMAPVCQAATTLCLCVGCSSKIHNPSVACSLQPLRKAPSNQHPGSLFQQNKPHLSVAFSLQLLGKALRIVCILEGQHAIPDLVGPHQALAVWPRAPTQQLHDNTMVMHMPVIAGLRGSDSVCDVLA